MTLYIHTMCIWFTPSQIYSHIKMVLFIPTSFVLQNCQNQLCSARMPASRQVQETLEPVCSAYFAREVQEAREAVRFAQKIRPAAKFKKHAKQCILQISPKTTSVLKRQDTCCSATSIGQTLFEVRRLNHGFVKKILSIEPEEGSDEQSLLNNLD